MNLRPNIKGLIMPTEQAKESFFERPFSSVIIEYELIVLHVPWQFIEW